MEEDVIQTLTPCMVRPRPNTYTYTKALAETLLIQEAGRLPCAIVRPSIVGASMEEPFPVSQQLVHVYNCWKISFGIFNIRCLENHLEHVGLK